MFKILTFLTRPYPPKFCLLPSEAVAQLLKHASELPADAKPVDKAELSKQVAEVTQRYTLTFLDNKLVAQKVTIKRLTRESATVVAKIDKLS